MLAIARAAACIAVVVAFALSAGCGGPQSRFTAYMSRGQARFAAGDYLKASVEFRNARQIMPKDARARVMAGRTAEKLGHLREAVALYQSVVDDTPDNLDARTDLGRLMIFNGVPERGLKVIEPALAKHPDDVALLDLRAAARVELKDKAGGVADVDRALQLAPANEEAVALRARLYQEDGDLPKAIALVSGALTSHPDSADLRTILANVYLAAGDSDKAEAQLKALIDLKPKEPSYRTELAQFYVHTHRLDDAQRVLEQSVKTMPQSDAAKLTLVDFVAAQRSQAEGQKLLRSYADAQPSDYELRLDLGSMLGHAGAVADATAAYDDVIRRDGTGPSGLTARYRLAVIALSQDRDADARRLVDQVLEKSPRDGDALMLRGEISLYRQDTTAAIADFRAVARDRPRNAGIQRLLARAYEANGDTTLAEQSLQTAIDIAPKDVSFRVQLGELLLRAESANEAVRVLEEAVRVAPADEPARVALVRAYLAKPDLSAAQTAAENLKTLSPNSAIGFYFAGLAAERQGRTDDARRDYQRALALDPKAFAPLEGLSDLERRHGQGARAIALVKDAAAREPKNALPENLLGGLYLAARNYPLATETLTQATTLAPNWPVPYRNLALTRLAAQDLPGAIAACQAGLKVSPADPQLVTELARLYTRDGKVDAALAVYDSAHRQNPRAQSIASDFAMMLVTYRSDRASLDRARELTSAFASSTDGTLLDSNGWVQVKRGEYRDALPVLLRAVERAPQSREIRYHLGIAEMHAGDSARARQDLQQAISGAGKSPWSEDARLALASLTTQTG